jgi:predicted homoserine dehydrogenase-like protein
LSQARRTVGLHVLGVADLEPARARAAFERTGWESDRISASSSAEAVRNGSTWITDDSAKLIAAPEIDVVIECTGVPAVGARHAALAIDAGHHVVMVNVEADVLVGPWLAARAREAGVIYSMAYGDQPALICEQVDWARSIGLEVVAAGKGTKYLPQYHQSTPDTVWDHYGFTPEQLAGGDFNPKMFNSFLDGTKSALEMAAVANATGLTPQADGLRFPPCSVDDLPSVCRPENAGGMLQHGATVEVVSSLYRDGSEVPRDLRWGTYVTFEADTDYVRRCFSEYGLVTDDTGRYSCLYRPSHLIGLELGISVASVALRGEPTGTCDQFRADVVATAKRDIAPGEILDGEGGQCVYGRLMRAGESLAVRAVPIGLADGVRVTRAVKAGQVLSAGDVALDHTRGIGAMRAQMEKEFGPPAGAQKGT